MPMSIKRSPRGFRVALGWTATLLILLLIVPLLFGIGAVFLGVATCSPSNVSGVCSPPIKLIVTLALLGGAFACSFPVLRFIRRYLMIDTPQTKQPAGDARSPTALPSALLGQAASLPLGQELVTGRVESYGPPGRIMRFNSELLTLWDLSPFQKGWLRQGDQLVVVYQKLPFGRRSKFLMAYWNGSQDPVRGVAALAQTLGIVIMSLTALGFWWLANSDTPWALAGCGVYGAVSLSYVLLMIRAKNMLRRFLAHVAV